VGRTFFRVVRKFAVVFAFVAIAGLVLGYCCIFILRDDSPVPEWFLRGIGVGCSIFYGWLLVLLIRKMSNKSWTDFCDWAISFFD
jgi:putative flippase GtrA